MPSFEADLSTAQHEMWIAESLDPGTSAFHVPLAIELCGELDQPALRAAIAALVARHEALRTSFVAREHGARQVVASDAMPCIEHIAPRDTGEAAVGELLAALAARPFELASGAVRVALIVLAPQRHILFLCLHHLVCDGWSLSILARELRALYRLGADALAPPAYQFVDWSEWQATLAPQPAAQACRDETCAMPPPCVLELAAPVPAPPHWVAASVDSNLTAPQWNELRRRAQQHGVTPFEWLGSLFGLFLARLYAVDELLLSVPVANRDREEFADTVGCLVQTVTLHLSLSPQLPFAHNLARLAPAMRAALAAGPLSPAAPAALARRQAAHDGAAHAPALFVLQNATAMDGDWGPQLRATPRPLENLGAKSDLAMRIEPRDGQARMVLEYRASRFPPSLALALGQAWHAWVLAVCADPARSVINLALAPAPMPQAALPAGAVADLWRGFEAQALRDG
ncbi:condensation domain-containing protein, partial [Janthinobacterium sp. PC23-8]|uniref:condensation domain-containing protein n=1 Tax=Janthinobacterium sp. PC23-8 TaxID=2012679 RepID=UPI001C3CB10B